MKLRKILIPILSCVILMIFSNITFATSSPSTTTSASIEKVIANIPKDKQKMIRDAFDAAKKDQTDVFLSSEEGKELTTYLESNPELLKDIIINTEVYKQRKNIKVSFGSGETKVFKFNDGTSITYSSKKIKQDSSKKEVSPNIVTGPYADANTVTTSWSVGHSTVSWITGYTQDDVDDTILITNTYPQANGYGLGAIANYNGDGTIDTNYSPYARTHATFTVGFSIAGWTDTVTDILITEFDGLGNPVHRNYVPAL